MKFSMWRDKRGDIFALIVVFSVLILTSYATFSFLTQLKNSGDIDSPARLARLYHDAEQFEKFAGDAAEFLIVNEYNRLLQDNEVQSTDCRYEDEILPLCGNAPEEELKGNLIKRVKEKMGEIIRTYPDSSLSGISFNVTLEGDEIHFTGEKKLVLAQEKATFPYEAAYLFKPDISISLHELGLNTFSEFMKIRDLCSKKVMTAEESQTCIEMNTFFNASVAKQNETFFTDLTSKNKFFLAAGDGAEYGTMKKNFVILGA